MQHLGLVDAVDHLLNRGAVIVGKSTISLANVDLIHLELKLLVSSVETLLQKAPPLPLVRDVNAPDPPLVKGGEGGFLWPPSPIQEEGDSLFPVNGEAGNVCHIQTAEEGVSTTKGLSSTRGGPGGVAVDPDGRPERGLAQLVLTLTELLRQVVERQAVRRMAGGGLSEEKVEAMGLALLELEVKMAELREIFGLTEDDVQLDLGPLGRLL